MGKFKKKNKEEFEEEVRRFLFLGNHDDANLLILKHTKDKIPEYARLSSILIVFGFKRLLVRLISDCGKFVTEFMDELNKVDKDFPLIDKWINEFIDNIRFTDAQELCRQFWQDRKESVTDLNFFSLKELFNAE